ncbi:hypothetical protein K0M31_016635 [Melipona bicolor]|uniref:Uncharacterized protein n=1 Tax=Melipona bicolor TaxID=60889 RepID=A0AA40FEA9_9HYME|nr:hypothetical protein K0M31_016635 [Melipona bicolor]
MEKGGGGSDDDDDGDGDGNGDGDGDGGGGDVCLERRTREERAWNTALGACARASSIFMCGTVTWGRIVDCGLRHAGVGE